MAFVRKKGDGACLKIRRINVDSERDKSDPEQSDYAYRVDLDEAVQNVVSITLTAYQFDKDMVPSFWPTTDQVQGNDLLDFSLANPALNGGLPMLFTVRLPNRTLFYAPNAPPDSDITIVLKELMNEAIHAVPGFEAITVGMVNLTQNINFQCVSAFPLFGITTLTLLFDSGPNRDSSPYRQLGFEQQDYKSYTGAQTAGIGGAITEIFAPFPSALQSWKYLDLLLRESDKDPVARVYLNNPTGFRVSLNETGLPQRNIDTDHPPRTLRKLDIFFRLPNGRDPRLYRLENAPHLLQFSVLQVANDIGGVPAYLYQELSF